VGGEGTYIGYYIVMSFSFVLMLSLVSALSFYSRWWTKFLSFVTGGARQFWSSLHKTAGLWSLWFLLIIALTGGWYFVEITRLYYGDGIYVYSGRGGFAAKRVPSPSENHSETFSLDRALQSVNRVRPDLRVKTVRMPNESGSMYVTGQADDWILRDWGNRVYLNAGTGKVLYSQDADDLSLYWYWSNMADPLHFGSFAGLYSKGVWFLFGLVLCVLILSGTYLHVRRLAQESEGGSTHRWPGTGSAMLLTLILLALTVPYGLKTVKSFGPTIEGVRHYPEVSLSVASVLLGWSLLMFSIVSLWIYFLWRPKSLPGRVD
jgi:uncharacterized iron-regulated membrane protein